MNKPYIELRTRTSFGDIINTYFTFLKYNFKQYTNLYLRYNAISIILSLVAAYLLVTGFMGLASRDFRFGMGNNFDNEGYFMAGGIVLLLVLFITTLINYSFSSAYVSDYVDHSGEVDAKRIWSNIKNNLGSVILLVLIGAAIYLGYIIVSLIISFIPLLGMLVQYGLSFLVAAFFGLSFMSIFSKNRTIGEAIGEGWSFTLSKFMKIILFGLVIGILNLMITWVILSVPTFILGIYVYFSVESQVDLATSVFANILFTFGFVIFILAFLFSQAISQIAYGALYYNLFEERYNEFLREKIEQIGSND